MQWSAGIEDVLLGCEISKNFETICGLEFVVKIDVNLALLLIIKIRFLTGSSKEKKIDSSFTCWLVVTLVFVCLQFIQQTFSF